MIRYFKWHWHLINRIETTNKIDSKGKRKEKARAMTEKNDFFKSYNRHSGGKRKKKRRHEILSQIERERKREKRKNKEVRRKKTWVGSPPSLPYKSVQQPDGLGG